MNPISVNSNAIPDDIIYHLGILLTDLERLKLDYNRDKTIQYKVENMSAKIFTIIQLYERYDKPSFRAIKNRINHLFSTKADLKGVIVHVENSRCIGENGIVEKLKISV